jgi:hypothetical protein
MVKSDAEESTTFGSEIGENGKNEKHNRMQPGGFEVGKLSMYIFNV